MNASASVMNSVSRNAPAGLSAASAMDMDSPIVGPWQGSGRFSPRTERGLGCWGG
jgi:hypothetical protein